MKHTKSSECFPLVLTNAFSEKYPGCWSEINLLCEAKKAGKLSWHDQCVIPIGATQFIVNGHGYDLSSPPAIIDASLMAALAPWRKHKQIYAFCEELEESLREQASDCKIPIEVFANLPYPCVYIKLSSFERYDGFFVHIEDDLVTHGLELRLTVVSKNYEIFFFPIHLLPDGTVMDGIRDALRTISEKSNSSAPLATADEYYSIVSGMVQLVLYLCAQNKEVVPDPEQERIYREPKAVVKDKYREVRKFVCGESVSAALQIYHRSLNVSSGSQTTPSSHSCRSSSHASSPKRPHMRKGHWHHYWSGTGRKNLILKWISPIMVRQDALSGSETPVRINDIQI